MRRVVFLLALAVLATPAFATWSIVAVDTETQEVGVASATCVTNIDLKAFLPAIVVGVGGGAAQSQVDGSGVRRQTMVNGFNNGLTSAEIIAQLEAISGSAFHQNGVARVAGDSGTFSGATTFAFSDGVTGSFGNVHYAIQGNILTGEPVLTEAELALINTAGDLPEKLMASMEAARAMGGDGRCSCSPANPTGCGAPPMSFTKAADVGFVLLARFGDTDDPTCNASGCADGDYYLDLNVANQSTGDVDPVIQLRGLFDTWRMDLENRPDAVQSTVTFAPDGDDRLLTLELVDWRGLALGFGGATVTVEHAPGSAGYSGIGAVVDQGDGTYEVSLTGNGGSGTDIFLVTIDDGIRPVVIPPQRASLDLAIFGDGFESGDTTAWSSTVD
ncbi:MAG: DUF1028 domain-containing protein [Acidobacteriota bacterium]